MLRWLKKLLIRFGWPIIKKAAIEFIKYNGEDLQIKLVEKLKLNYDIPLADENAEKKFNEIVQRYADEIYDLAQYVLIEYINQIDIEEIINNFYAKKK